MAVTVVVDDREAASGVPRRLVRLGAVVEVRRLEYADYVVSDKVAFERKTVNDFLTSLADKRLFEQTSALLRLYERPVVVVEGDVDKALMFRRFTYKHLYGAVSALVTQGVSVVMTRDEDDTAYLIYSAARRLQEPVKRPYLPPTKMSLVRPGRTLPEVQRNLIAVIPGIGPDLADKILRHFKTPRRFFKASASELRKIGGLGQKRVERIIAILDTVYRGLDNNA